MKSLLSLIIAAAAIPLYGDVDLNPIFTDNMVLQREQPIKVYGEAAPAEKVEVAFAGQTLATTADDDGAWLVEFDPVDPGGPFEMTVKGKNTIKLGNILVGDVWVLSGQSNMAREFRTYSWLMENLHEMETNDHIRWFKVDTNASVDERTKELPIDPPFEDSWQVSSRALLPQFSPAGHFFSLHRYKQNNVPIGLVYASRGATQAASWVPRRVLDSSPEYKRIMDPEQNNNLKPVDGKPNPRRPTGFYYGMVAPLQPFTIKGVLWYQGESDSRYSQTYRTLFPDLIRAWRKDWGQGNFPFVYAQLSSSKDRNWSILKEPRESSWAWQREAQESGLQEPNTAMIATYDIGEWEDIHPQEKDEVGRRFALAVAKMEGEAPKTMASGPVFDDWKRQGDHAILRFDKTGDGLETRTVKMNRERNFAPGKDPDAFVFPEDTLSGFIVCGPDKVFHPAQAKITGDNTVEVWSDEVETPIAVRYAWATFAHGNLYNSAGLPAFPFRTDRFKQPPVLKERDE